MSRGARAAIIASATALAALTKLRTAYAYGGQDGLHASGMDVEAHVIFGYGFERGPGYAGGFGLGLRFGVPIVPRGLLSSVRDSLVLSFGADYIYWAGSSQPSTFWSDSEIVAPVVLQWNFYLSPSLSVFPEAGVAVGVGGCPGCLLYALPDIALGMRVHFDGESGYPALVIRVGFPVGITLGVAL